MNRAYINLGHRSAGAFNGGGVGLLIGPKPHRGRKLRHSFAEAEAALGNDQRRETII